MLDMYVGGRFALDATDPRNQFHRQALLEARLVHDYRDSVAALHEGASPRGTSPESRSGLAARLRLAFAGAGAPVTPQPCDCLGSAS